MTVEILDNNSWFGQHLRKNLGVISGQVQVFFNFLFLGPSLSIDFIFLAGALLSKISSLANSVQSFILRKLQNCKILATKTVRQFLYLTCQKLSQKKCFKKSWNFLTKKFCAEEDKWPHRFIEKIIYRKKQKKNVRNKIKEKCERVSWIKCNF